jgi:hypothetical protein
MIVLTVGTPCGNHSLESGLDLGPNPGLQALLKGQAYIITYWEVLVGLMKPIRFPADTGGFSTSLGGSAHF